MGFGGVNFSRINTCQLKRKKEILHMENPISINEKQNKKIKIHMENPTCVLFN